MPLVKTMLWFVIAGLASVSVVACGELDPVNVQNLCVGDEVFDKQCPQCQSLPFASQCPQCQQSGLDPETCLPPGTVWSDIGRTDGGMSSLPGDGQAGSSNGMDGRDGRDGRDGADGKTPDSNPNNPGNPDDGSPPGDKGAAGAGANGGQVPVAGSDGAGQLPSGEPGQPGARGCVTNDDCLATPGRPACRPDGLCTECLDDSHCPDRQCDIPVNRCVGCLDDAFCEPQGKVCNRASQVCVQCRDDGQCSGATPACSLSQECVPCLKDIHCHGDRPACDQMTCYECTIDQHCESTGKHACIEEEHHCVECERDSQCQGEAGRPLCDVAANACVECLEDSDCSDRSASHCDSGSHTCVPCSSHDHCAAFKGSAPRCASGECVACDEDGGICNGKACILSQNVCSTKNRQSVKACGECVTRDECITGHVCVNVKFGSYNTGNFCMPSLPDFKQCPRPYSRKVPNVSTLDGNKAQTLCALPENTTCQALNDLLEKKSCNDNNAACGLGRPVLGTNDGLCPNSVCTYNCTGSEFCPPNMICSEEQAVCL